MGLDGLNDGAAKHGIQPPGILQQPVNVGSGNSVRGSSLSGISSKCRAAPRCNSAASWIGAPFEYSKPPATGAEIDVEIEACGQPARLIDQQFHAQKAVNPQLPDIGVVGERSQQVQHRPAQRQHK